jgi:predicted dehydrogenase
MGDKLRIGFVGCGYMGQKAHMDNYVTIPECEIVALAEGRAQTAEIVARKYNIPQVYSDHREMLEKADIDAVVAIMYYGLHRSVVPDILKTGKPCLTEKPICVGAENAQFMVDTAAASGSLYYIGYMKRSTPAARMAVDKIREWKASGQAGGMKYIRASMPPGDWIMSIEGPVGAGDAPPPYEGVTNEPMPAWMPEGIANIYNAFVNYYIHQVNMIRYLLGEDFHVTWADPSGAVLGAMSDSGVPIILEMQGYGLRDAWEETYRVVFDNGKIDLSIPSPMQRQNGGALEVLFTGGQTQVYERPVVPPHWAFLEEARHFVACVQGKDTPRAPMGDAVKDLQVAEEYARLLSAAR